ncbi:hypothetical protein BMS3Abin04_02270 [bacterium BMS3Abin04]|nr:hypothetical protein BMS3Abin04_02270 [bacterium BMS3Abin04]
MGQQDFSRVKDLINSDDVSVIKVTAENFLLTEMPDQIVAFFAEKLLSSHYGIRDSVSNALILNKNQRIPEIVMQYIASQNSYTRNLAGEILLAKGDKSVDALLNHLHKGDDDEKKFVIDILGLIGNVKSEDAIIDLLNESKEDNVLLACIEALGNIKSKKGIKPIIKMFDIDELFHPTIMEALGKIGGEEAAEFILENYSQVDDLTKFSIIESLGTSKNKNAFYLLSEHLKSYSGPLAWATLEALIKLKKDLNLVLEYDEKLRAIILDILLEGDDRYKIAAINFTKSFEDKEILITSMNIYGENEEIDEKLRYNFFSNSELFLSYIPEIISASSSNIKLLLQTVKDIIANDGGESYLKLSELNRNNFANALASNLRNHDEEVRMLCVELLFFLSPETALMFLDTMVEDDSLWNKLRLMEIIRESSDKRIITTIQKLADDPEEMVKETAEQILNVYGLLQ